MKVDQVDAFGIFWCAMVALIGVTNTAWAINDLKRGSARASWFGARVARHEEPFEFWMAVGGKLISLPVCCFMLWFGSGVFPWGRS